MILLQHKITTNQMIGSNSFLALTKNPADFTAIYDMDAVLRQTHLATISTDYLKTQPGMTKIMQERYLASIPNVDALLNHPQDSLGYSFTCHLKSNGFDTAFYRQIAVENDITYITLRRSQTHNIHHIIIGFGTDLASGIVNQLDSPDQLERTMDCIHQGWQMGLKAKPLMAQK